MIINYWATEAHIRKYNPHLWAIIEEGVVFPMILIVEEYKGTYIIRENNQANYDFREKDTLNKAD